MTFRCKLCGKLVVNPDKPIFYDLCDECFKEFDAQKMRGRWGIVVPSFFGAKGVSNLPYFEDADEWIRWKKSEKQKGAD